MEHIKKKKQENNQNQCSVRKSWRKQPCLLECRKWDQTSALTANTSCCISGVLRKRKCNQIRLTKTILVFVSTFDCMRRRDVFIDGGYSLTREMMARTRYHRAVMSIAKDKSACEQMLCASWEFADQDTQFTQRFASSRTYSFREYAFIVIVQAFASLQAQAQISSIMLPAVKLPFGRMPRQYNCRNLCILRRTNT